MNLVLESKEQVTRDKMRHCLKGHPFRRDNSLGALIIVQCSFLGDAYVSRKTTAETVSGETGYKSSTESCMVQINAHGCC
jgi:hypothetical protein